MQHAPRNTRQLDDSDHAYWQTRLANLSRLSREAPIIDALAVPCSRSPAGAGAADPGSSIGRAALEPLLDELTDEIQRRIEQSLLSTVTRMLGSLDASRRAALRYRNLPST